MRISAGCDTTVPLTGTCKAARVTVVPATVSLSSGVLRVKTPPDPGALCRSTPESTAHPAHPSGPSLWARPPAWPREGQEALLEETRQGR